MIGDLRNGIGVDFGAEACRAGLFEGGVFRETPPAVWVPGAPEGPGLRISSSKDRWLRLETVKANIGTVKKLRDAKGHQPGSFEDQACNQLKSLRANLERHLGAEIAGAAVGVPSCYGMNQRAALRTAASLSGFGKVALIDESTAAALFQYRGHEGSFRILAYCLGKSVFSASVLSLEDGKVRALCHEGSTQIGGQDFDALIAQDVISRLSLTDRMDFMKCSEAIHDLLAHAERARIGLDNASEVFIEFEAWKDLVGPQLCSRLSICASRFEELASPLVAETVSLARKAVHGAGLTSQDLGEILFVGEATRTPLVRRELAAAFGRPCVHAVPHAVACGAALYAASLWNCFAPGKGSNSAPGPSDGEMADALETAFRNFNRALSDRDPEAGESAFKALLDRVREELSFLYSRRSSELRQEGRWDEAQDLLERGLKCWPANSHIRKLLAERYAEKALQLARRQRLHLCQEHLRKSLELDPGNAWALRLQEEMAEEMRGVPGGRGKHSRGRRGRR